MQPRQERMGRMEPLPAPGRAGRATTPGGPGRSAGRRAPSVTVTGPAEALALLLWGRTTPADERLTVDGDAAALDDALGRRLTP